jgi:predicted acylesterase/phospholipase RssA
VPPAEAGALRHALRLAQISTIGAEQDSLVERIGSFRLRLLQLLAPALPTDPRRIDAAELCALVPRARALVDDARRRVLEAGLASEEALDAELVTKRLALVLGGAAGSSYVFLGALDRLRAFALEPDYLVGCSMGALLGVARARSRRFDLAELYEELGALRAGAIFRPPAVQARFGLPAALRLDLRRALGDRFRRADGGTVRLSDLSIPTDVLVTGVGAAALGRPRDEYAKLVDADLRGGSALAELRGGAVARVVSALVALAMSRRVLVPVFFGADATSAAMPALDAAGFSAAIPALLHYDTDGSEPQTDAILRDTFERHGLVALVDGALVSTLPARYAWEAIESGRIGSRHAAIVALDAMVPGLGRNAPLAPIQRVIAATAQRDRPFWDVHVEFRRVPNMLELFPREATLRRAQSAGEDEFEETAHLLRALLAPLPRWKDVCTRLRSPGDGL